MFHCGENCTTASVKTSSKTFLQEEEAYKQLKPCPETPKNWMMKEGVVIVVTVIILLFMTMKIIPAMLNAPRRKIIMS